LEPCYRSADFDAGTSTVSLLFAGLVGVAREPGDRGPHIVFFCQIRSAQVVAHWQNRPIDGLAKITIWPLSRSVIGASFVQDPIVYVSV
jgi:hypothetical protein